MQLRVLRVRGRRACLDEHRGTGAMAVLLVLENVKPRQLALLAHLPGQLAGEVPQHVVVWHRCAVGIVAAHEVLQDCEWWKEAENHSLSCFSGPASHPP